MVLNSLDPPITTINKSHEYSLTANLRVNPLLDEVDVLWLALTLERDVVQHVDSAVHELLLRQQTLEDELSVIQVEAVQVLSLNLLLA